MMGNYEVSDTNGIPTYTVINKAALLSITGFNTFTNSTLSNVSNLIGVHDGLECKPESLQFILNKSAALKSEDIGDFYYYLRSGVVVSEGTMKNDSFVPLGGTCSDPIIVNHHESAKNFL